MIGKFWPLTALILALACVCLCGCEYLGEEPKLVESGSNKGIGFAMVSDSTALLAVDYYERYERSSGADWRECVKKGIRLVGTKGIEINYWEGLVDCRGEIDPLSRIHPLGDSTVLFQLSDQKNEFRQPLKITPKRLFTNKLTFTIFSLVTKRGFLYGPAQLF